MLQCFMYLFIYCVMGFTDPTNGISVQIDGLLNFGPKWNFIYQIVTDNNVMSKAADVRSGKENGQFDEKMLKNETIFDDASINDTKHDDYLDLLSLLSSTEDKNNKERNDTDLGRLEGNQLNPTKSYIEQNNVKKTKRSEQKNRNSKANEFGEVKEDFSDHEHIKFVVTRKNKKKEIRKPKYLDLGYISKEMYRAHKVKEDTRVHDFTVHVYKQSLRVFDDIKKLTNDRKFKRKVSALKRSYEDRFSDFLKMTYNHTLKTEFGYQKVILNTIDTSNKLLQRLINHLLHDMDAEILQTNIGTVNVFQKEIDKEKEVEIKHACKKLGVCRLNNDLSDFLVDILTIILKTVDKKVKQAADALTEALKNTDYDNIFDYDVARKFKKIIADVEMWDAFKSRAMFAVLRNIIKNKNKPIVVIQVKDNYLANKTLAFHDVINILNEKLTKVECEKEWKDIKSDLTDWKEDRYGDVSLIAVNLVNNLVGGLKRMDIDTKRKFNEYVRVLLSSVQ